MTGPVIPFPARRRAAHSLPPSWSRDWSAQYGPFVDAALDLARTDDGEFTCRCRAITEGVGPGVVEQLGAQVERIAAQLAGIVTVLSSLAMRIRVAGGAT